jgi:hypothetical protein
MNKILLGIGLVTAVVLAAPVYAQGQGQGGYGMQDGYYGQGGNGQSSYSRGGYGQGGNGQSSYSRGDYYGQGGNGMQDYTTPRN